MKKAVIYARYSSDSQSEQSIDGQLRVCKEYAERENIKIVDTYIDRAMTGTNDHRPDFQRMLRDSIMRKKKSNPAVRIALTWCGRWESNPHGIATTST